MSNSPEGHRQRLRQRFLSDDPSAKDERSLLELLLCYAIPQRDVRPLADRLIRRFGDLTSVLKAEKGVLCTEEGIKESTATLLKLVNHIVERSPESMRPIGPQVISETGTSETPAGAADAPPPRGRPSSLFDDDGPPRVKPRPESPTRSSRVGKGPQVFSKSLLKETLQFLPALPNTTEISHLREFIRTRLHYSSETTRNRRVNYILRRMFPAGVPDTGMMQFAKTFEGRQELRDVIFYRFCLSESLMPKVIDELFIPAIGAGTVARVDLRSYLTALFPDSKTLDDCSQAIAEALVTSGIAKSDRQAVHFAYRDIALPSFAFILHSVFPEPGMYKLSELEDNPAVRQMFWNPDRILPSIYELRNAGVLSKVSEIDSVRQFTTRYDLAGVVNVLKEPLVRK